MPSKLCLMVMQFFIIHGGNYANFYSYQRKLRRTYSVSDLRQSPALRCPLWHEDTDGGGTG